MFCLVLPCHDLVQQLKQGVLLYSFSTSSLEFCPIPFRSGSFLTNIIDLGITSLVLESVFPLRNCAQLVSRLSFEYYLIHLKASFNFNDLRALIFGRVRRICLSYGFFYYDAMKHIHAFLLDLDHFLRVCQFFLIFTHQSIYFQFLRDTETAVVRQVSICIACERCYPADFPTGPFILRRRIATPRDVNGNLYRVAKVYLQGIGLYLLLLFIPMLFQWSACFPQGPPLSSPSESSHYFLISHLRFRSIGLFSIFR